MQPTSQKSPPQISPEQTCGQEDSRVRIFRSLAASEGLTEQEVDSFLHLLNSSKAKVLKIDPHGLSLKMLRISYPFMEDGTLRPFSIRWPHSAMLVLLRHIADYVIVDCTSLLTGNVLATTALEVADDVLRVCSCDLKAISYFSSYLSLVADRKFKPEQHIKVLSNTRPYQGGSEYENSFGGVKYRLPYLPSLEEQAATLKLLEPLSGKEAKTYEPVIAAIAGEVFGDGK